MTATFSTATAPLVTYRDRNGLSLPADKWAELIRDPVYCRVRHTVVRRDIEIVLTWVGVECCLERFPELFLLEIFELVSHSDGRLDRLRHANGEAVQPETAWFASEKDAIQAWDTVVRCAASGQAVRLLAALRKGKKR